MLQLPPVSIIVAAYNSERTIARCIESLLLLDYPEYEIIVVDNNSTDKTADIIKKYDVIYLFEGKKGWPAARNTGILQAASKYVANIDADCFATPKWLQYLVSGFVSGGTGVVVGKTLVEEGKTLAQKYYSSSNPFVIESKINAFSAVPWGGGNNVMVREAFVRAGGYDSDRFTSGADTEFHVRLQKEFNYKTRYEPKALIYHEARGSLSEFFCVSAKYSYDGFLRSRMKVMRSDHHVEINVFFKPIQMSQKNYYRFFLPWKLYKILLLISGTVYRGFKLLLGRETPYRVASNLFSIVNESGMLYGYCKSRLKYTLKRKG